MFKNKGWLKVSIKLDQQENYTATPGPSVQGRPRKPFEELCKRSQQMKVKDLVSTRKTEELSFAAQVSLRKCGKRTAAYIVKDVTQNTSRLLSALSLISAPTAQLYLTVKKRWH